MVLTKSISTRLLEPNTGQIEGLPSNPRQWTKDEMDRLKKSIKETPELLEARGAIVYPHDGNYIVLGGNMRLSAVKSLGWKEMPCVVLPDDMPVEKLKEIVIKDNGSFGEWDMDALANDWDDLPLSDWGANVAWDNLPHYDMATASDKDEIERRKREFEERMAAGEISEEDEEYQEFLEKFKLKKTTDDCYTPEIVYDGIADWVEKRYSVKKSDFVRPFYPGGDYKKEQYKESDIVVDNPPFSILAEIILFYITKGIRFFLFCPHLTQFSSSSKACCLCVGVPITYENGANVNTSFVTNMEDPAIQFKSEPSLYAVVKVANDTNLKQKKSELPKYSYDKHIITTPFLSSLSRYGIEFSVPCTECEGISQLDAQKQSGKAIFGKGYIVSDRIVAEREKAEREKAEREKAAREKAEREKAAREKAKRWELSDREKAIVARLNSRMSSF